MTTSIDENQPHVQVEASELHEEAHGEGLDYEHDASHVSAKVEQHGEGFRYAAVTTKDQDRTYMKVTNVVPKETKPQPPQEEAKPEVKQEEKQEEALAPQAAPLEESELRYGTIQLFEVTNPPKPKMDEPSSLSALMPRIMNVVFFVLSMNSFFSQIIVGFKWLTEIPLLGLFIFAKEFFGFALVILPAIPTLLKRPEGRAYDDFLNPFNPRTGILKSITVSKKVQYLISSWCYGIGCLSNLRSAVSLLIAIRWDISLPVMAEETELQKVGNLFFLAVDLLIKTRNENKAVNSYLFKSLIINSLMVCLSHVGHFAKMNQISDWLKDMDEGKLTKEQIAVGLASQYQFTMGEGCNGTFQQNAMGEQIRIKKEKVE